MSTSRRKTWQEKLTDNKGLPKIGRVMGRMRKTWGTGTLVVPAPIEVDEVMRRVPKGRVTTINQIRAALAKKHHVEMCCPITTGIFSWIAAHAAEEAAAEGKKRITPYWRTLKGSGELNPKYPGGIESQAQRLRAEGHIIEPGQGKKPPRVQDLENRLAKV
jgi:alkylated DNA nucleotide flippase Atl1